MQESDTFLGACRDSLFDFNQADQVLEKSFIRAGNVPVTQQEISTTAITSATENVFTTRQESLRLDSRCRSSRDSSSLVESFTKLGGYGRRCNR